MSELVKGSLNKVVDSAEFAGKSALDAVDAVQNAAFETASQAVSVGDKSVDAAMLEARELFARAVTLVREIVNAVAEPLP